jgi:hypothetical protein
MIGWLTSAALGCNPKVVSSTDITTICNWIFDQFFIFMITGTAEGKDSK